MLSIQNKVIAIIFLSIGALGYLSVNTFYSYSKYKENRHGLAESFELTEIANRIHAQVILKSHLKKLNHLKSKVTFSERTKAVNTLIKAYESRSGSKLAWAKKYIANQEMEYRNFLNSQLPILENRIQYYGSLSLLTLFTALFLTFFILNASLFHPLKDIRQKMVDFLNDKYTYQFSVPPNNEIGQLQSSFNSMAQKVLSQMDDLQLLDKAKSEFLSIASHELRTPLTSIKGSLSLLKSEVTQELNEATQSLLQIAEVETNRLIRLINDILDLSKIEAHMLPIEQDWQPLNELIETTLQSLKALADTANVTLEAVGDINFETYMDADRIQQVLTNLISNAIKFSPPNGVVEVFCQASEHSGLVIAVKDQGKGIAPEDQQAIFEKFRQATSPSTPLVKGTGLGLAIAKALVEIHNGHIGVDSKPNQGSTFFFTLPQWRTETSQINYLAKPSSGGAA